MKNFIIYIFLIFSISSAFADKYKFVNAEDRIKNADFIGLVKVVNGELIQSTPKDYKYSVLIKDVIKGELNLKGQKINLMFSCGLSLADEYLVYAYIDDITGLLGTNCPEGILLKTYKVLPDLKIQVIVPNYFIDKIPVLEGGAKDICQLTIEYRCESSYQGKSIDYQNIKKIIKGRL